MQRALKWTAISLGGVILIVFLLLFAVNTRPGRDFLAGQLNNFTTASGLGLHVDRIDGSIYGRMTLVGLALSDPQGRFLTAPKVTVDWHPLAYLHGKIDIDELLAPRINLLRAPELRQAPADPDAPVLPDIDAHIGRLAIDRLEIRPPITGKRHVVQLAGSADVDDGRLLIDADARALSLAGAAGGDRLSLRLDAAPDDNRLLIDARLSAPVGGLVDSFAGLGQPLTAEITGKGDWQNWNGTASAKLSENPLLALGIRGRDGRFIVDGKAFPSRVLSGAAARLTEPAVIVGLDATMRERRLEGRLEARSAAFALRAQGLVDLAENRFGDLVIKLALNEPGTIAENLRARNAGLELALDGPFAKPTIAYEVNADQLGFGSIGIENLRASGRSTIESDRMLIPVDAKAGRISGVETAAGGTLTNVTINGQLVYGGGRISADNLHIGSDRINADAIILADLDSGTYTGALKGRVNDYVVDGIGRMRLAADAKLVTAPNGALAVSGWVRAKTSRIDNGAIAGLLGGNADIFANVALDSNGTASVRNLKLTAPDFRIISGEGSYRSDGGLTFRARAVSDQYGPIQVDGGGTVDRPQLRLVAARPGLGIGATDFTATVQPIPTGYAVNAKGNSDYGPLTADVLVDTEDGPLAITVRDGRIVGIEVSGTVRQSPAGPFTGALQLAGSGITGQVRLSAAGEDQRAALSLNASAARIPGAQQFIVGQGRVRATALLGDETQVSGTAQLSNMIYGENFTLTNARARFNYANGSGRIALTAAGESGAPFDIAAQAALAPEQIIANVKGSAGNTDFHLAAPARLTRDGNGWRLADTTVVLPEGRMRLSGNFGNRTALHIVLDGVDLRLANIASPDLRLGGTATGTIDYTSAGNAIPTVDARLNLENLTRAAAYMVSEPVDISLLAELSQGGGEFAAAIRRNGNIAGRLQARIGGPRGDGAWTERLARASLSGGVRYNGPAEVLWTLTGLADQDLTGPVVIAADFGGTLDQPAINGVVRSDALRYENQTYGTVLRRIAVDGRFNQSALQINSLSARAGDGSLSANGTIGLDAASGFPMNVTLKLDRAQLAKSNSLAARVSGDLSVTRSASVGGLIQGELRLPEARYRIVRQGAAEIVTLTGVRRKNAPPQIQKTASPSFADNWKLDIRVTADNQIFVSGMGLEAELASDLRVTGTAADPRIIGSLNVVRGTYSFAGRRFDLDDDGRIIFNGGPVTNPELALAASGTVDNLTATINIDGTATSPQISFTSAPALPQDEVLSRILFGGSVTSLSPTQAIQLAAALNSLRGSGGGLNPLGKLRSAAGIDRLRILGADEATGRGTSLAAGQYISNDIYVEIITDARGFTATQLEIALSKALSILSATGSLGGSSVGLQYSKDY